MFAFVLRRLLVAIPTIIVITAVAFFMMKVAPGGPFDLERPMPEEIRERLLAEYGLDQPVWKQYIDYMVGLVQGDFGPSLKFLDKDVAELIGEGLPVSLMIGALAMLVAVFLGTFLGAVAALRQNTSGDFAVMSFAMIGVSIPPLVMGPILALVLGVYMGILPTGGLNFSRYGLSVLVLPVITLALPQIAIIARLMRASMIEVIRSNYIRTARAKGLSAVSVIIRHALRAAVLPLVSYLGPASAAVISGSLVIERVFQLPGMGAYFVDAALQRDYTLVMGVVVVYATLIIVLNLIADLIYSVLNPRVSYDS